MAVYEACQSERRARARCRDEGRVQREKERQSTVAVALPLNYVHFQVERNSSKARSVGEANGRPTAASDISPYSPPPSLGRKLVVVYAQMSRAAAPRFRRGHADEFGAKRATMRPTASPDFSPPGAGRYRTQPQLSLTSRSKIRLQMLSRTHRICSVADVEVQGELSSATSPPFLELAYPRRGAR
ncbi:hypothetical protein BD414DRAFT_501375 [Trametes punicea]|nr:hypothetical protein BD414DRAFT_501375 [Trametes punicea]